MWLNFAFVSALESTALSSEVSLSDKGKWSALAESLVSLVITDSLCSVLFQKVLKGYVLDP